MRKLYLASTSPRRRELMDTLRIPYRVIEPAFEELGTGYAAEKECLYLAEQKAKSVQGLCPDALILGCDTMIEFLGEKIGKPKDKNHAIEILSQLSGKAHRVLTALVLLDTRSQLMKHHLEETRVVFRKLTIKEIRDYVTSGEPMDKAGAYAIQGGGRKFVAEIEGDEQSVIGLPLKIVREWLRPIFSQIY